MVIGCRQNIICNLPTIISACSPTSAAARTKTARSAANGAMTTAMAATGALHEIDKSTRISVEQGELLATFHQKIRPSSS